MQCYVFANTRTSEICTIIWRFFLLIPHLLLSYLCMPAGLPALPPSYPPAVWLVDRLDPVAYRAHMKELMGKAEEGVSLIRRRYCSDAEEGVSLIRRRYCS